MKLRLEMHGAPLALEVTKGKTFVNGILLFGRPKTGKTTLAHAMAKDCGYNLYDVSPAQ